MINTNTMDKKRFAFVPVVWLLLFAQLGQAQDLSNLKDTKPVTVSGGINLMGGLYSVDGIEPRQPDAIYSLSCNFTVNIYNLSLPFSFLVGNQENNYSQPFNRFGVSPKYQWITLHLGHRNVKFSPYTLAGHSFLGVGVEINPGLFRFGAVYGNFRREVASDSTNLDAVPAYKRKGYSFKIGVGNQENYFDFILFKAKDDTLSAPGFTVEDNVLPAENLVVGVSSRISTKSKLFFEFDYAASAYTRDIRAQGLDESEIAYAKPLLSMFNPKATSQVLTAAEAAVGYKGKTMGLSLRYKRVDPDYQSMGAYYFKSDVENITIAPYVKLFKRRLNIKSSLGFEHNNLKNTKAAQTNRTIGSLSVLLRPVKNLNLNFNYSNYGIAQRDGYREIHDTIRMQQNNKSISGGANYTIVKEKNTHSFNINSSYQALEDLNSQTAEYSESKTYNMQYNYAYTYLPAGFNAFLSYIRTRSKAMVDQERIFSGPGFGVAKQWLDNTLNTSFNMNYMSNSLNGDKEGNITNLSSLISYKIKKKHRIKMIYNFIKSNSDSATTISYRESTIKLSYSYSF
jgi:hypothetical protein